jgi:hypothetical protein
MMTVSWFMVHYFEICANLEVEFFPPPRYLLLRKGRSATKEEETWRNGVQYVQSH